MNEEQALALTAFFGGKPFYINHSDFFDEWVTVCPCKDGRVVVFSMRYFMEFASYADFEKSLEEPNEDYLLNFELATVTMRSTVDC